MIKRTKEEMAEFINAAYCYTNKFKGRKVSVPQSCLLFPEIRRGTVIKGTTEFAKAGGYKFNVLQDEFDCLCFEMLTNFNKETTKEFIDYCVETIKNNSWIPVEQQIYTKGSGFWKYNIQLFEELKKKSEYIGEI